MPHNHGPLSVGFNPQERRFLHKIDRKFNKISVIILIILILGILGGLSIAYLILYSKNISISSTNSSSNPQIKFANSLIDTQKQYPESLQPATFICPIQTQLCQNPASFLNGSLTLKTSHSFDIYAAFDGTVQNLPSTHPSSTGDEK